MIQLLVVLAIFFISMVYAYPLDRAVAETSRTTLGFSIASSTASACIFYFVFTIVPDILSRVRRRRSYYKQLGYLFRCSASFDFYIGISNSIKYIGYDNGHLEYFDKLSPDSRIAYSFSSASKERFDRKTPNKVGQAFCLTILEIIEHIKKLHSNSTRRHKDFLERIENEANDFLESPKQFKELQGLRASIWRQLDDILNEINTCSAKHNFYAIVNHIIEFENYGS